MDPGTQCERPFGNVGNPVTPPPARKERFGVGGLHVVQQPGVGVCGGQKLRITEGPATIQPRIILDAELQAAGKDLAHVFVVVGASPRSENIIHNQVIEVRVEGDQLRGERPLGIQVSEAELRRKAFFFVEPVSAGSLPGGTARARWRKTAVETGQQLQIVGAIISQSCLGSA